MRPAAYVRRMIGVDLLVCASHTPPKHADSISTAAAHINEPIVIMNLLMADILLIVIQETKPTGRRCDTYRLA